MKEGEGSRAVASQAEDPWLEVNSQGVSFSWSFVQRLKRLFWIMIAALVIGVGWMKPEEVVRLAEFWVMSKAVVQQVEPKPK